MPKGFEEEIASRGEGIFRFVALLAPRALIDWPTLAPSLNRDQLSWWRVFLIGSPRQWQLRLGRRAYAKSRCGRTLLVKLDDGSRWQVLPRHRRLDESDADHQ